MTAESDAPTPVTVGIGHRKRVPDARRLTAMQRPLWTSQLLRPDAPLQNMALVSHFSGRIDPDRLAAAFDSVMSRSDALRTRIVEIGNETRIVLDAEPPDHERVDGLSRSEFVVHMRQRITAPLDMSVRGVDSVIALHDDGTSSWYLALHHTITDAASSALVFDATAAAYDDPHATTPDSNYYRWADEQHVDTDQEATNTAATRRARRRQRALAHWDARDAAPKIARLYQPTRTPTTASSRLGVPLSAASLTNIEHALDGDFRMLHADLAWATFLATATAAYVHHVSGADRFSIGLPVHNRSDVTSRSLIGPVMELFPLDVSIEAGDTLRRLHHRVSSSMMALLTHAAPGTAPAADFAAVVNVTNRMHATDFGGFDASTTWLESGAIDPSHLLRVQLTGFAGDAQTILALDVNHGGADENHRSRLTGHFASILDALATDADGPVDRSLIDDDELAVLQLWESAHDHAPLDEAGDLSSEAAASTVVDMVRRNLSGVDATVLTDGDDHWTGSQLLERADALANWLIERGVTAGSRVGIELPRGADAVTAILATLFTGASFVPLDVAHPELRRRDLARRGRCALVLDRLPDDLHCDLGESLAADRSEIDSPSPDEEAYLLFTSGSTGEPKGVPIMHAGLADYLRFAVAAYVGDKAPIVPLFTSLGFDLTITSLFLPLVVPGGEMITIDADGPAAVSEIARTTRLNWCKATPSHLAMLTRLMPPEHELATLVVGGEAFGSGLAQRLLDANPALEIFNEYGPTEAVVGCMIHRVDPAHIGGHAEVPIGVPAPGVTLRVVSPALARVPIGAVGELCIHRAHMSSGYLMASEADQHLDDRYIDIDGKRFYRSGDLVRMVDDETLVYLGRVDEQVKVGGIRLEPTEVEDALVAHPSITSAAVRLWSPTPTTPDHRCVRCGLASNVPGVSFDDVGVCSTCHSYDRVAPQAASWFRTEDDLRDQLQRARERRTGKYDFLHLLSGGKDSTYALYRMVQLGYRPYVMTLDNGFIAEEAKDNVRRSVAELDLDHEFATTDAMNAIFRDSLERHSNVCHGCYKTIYTLATTRAAELGISMIVTGLSRGQLFETRLIPQQFAPGRFDPDAIDRAVVSARKRYHRLDDGPNRLLDTSVFDDDAIFEQVEYLDFYRYVDVELAEMLSFLDSSAPWVRPKDSGRSTNCLVNAAGIHNHVLEQGFHNYAVPYAWDVRLGHKTRTEAIEELDDQLDVADVSRMLDEIGHTPNPREVLTAWIEVADGHSEPTPAELRRWVAETMPKHAVPAAFVAIDTVPLTTNGKLDIGRLPAPLRTHRGAGGITVAPETELEAAIVAVWESVLQTEPIGVDDDFFALGGDSLAALEMSSAVEAATGRRVDDDDAFVHSTPRRLAAALDEGRAGHDAELTASSSPAPSDSLGTSLPQPCVWGLDDPPPLSPGELTILFEQSRRPDAVMYNVARRYVVHGALDGDRFAAAVRTVAERHVPLSWTFGARRRLLDAHHAVEVDISIMPRSIEALDADISALHHRPFDLDGGPLLRCWIQPLDDGSTLVMLVCHHVSADADSFTQLWSQIDHAYQGGPDDAVGPLADYPSIIALQGQTGSNDEAGSTLTIDVATSEPSRLCFTSPTSDEADGFLTRRASVARRSLTGRAATTGFGTALAAVVATLRSSSDGDDVVVRAIASNRLHPAAEPLVGYFLSTVPVGVECRGDQRLDELERQANAAAATALSPHRRSTSGAEATPESADSPMILLAFDDLSRTSFDGMHVDQRVLSNGTAVADATFFVELRDDHVELSLEHRGSFISHEIAAQLLDDLDAALTAIIEQPASTHDDWRRVRPLSTTSLLRGSTLDAPSSIVPAIAAHLDARRNDIAVHVGDQTLSWAALADRTTVIAQTLSSRGVEAGDRVLIAIGRTTDLVAAMLATLRLGAVYVPLDPSYPADRIRLIVEAANSTAALVASNDQRVTANDIALDALADAADTTDGSFSDSEGARTDIQWPDAAQHADDTAYIIFTSGSTGIPRGVPVSHRQLAASTAARAGVYDRVPERFLVVSSPAFDSSIVGLLWPLATGGCVVLPTEREAHDVDALLDLFDSAAVTHTLMVPALYEALLERGRHRTAWPAQVIVAGEACTPSLVRRHAALRPDAALTNEYGPTEATVWATAQHCHPGRALGDMADIPIGSPIPGTWVAIVDSNDRPVPVGTHGQLVIGGAGVVDGYLDQSLAEIEATEAKFATGASAELLTGRFFRSGDRAVVEHINGARVVRFLGRIDDQLNVGGARVEPEDIERVISADPLVGAVVVTVDDPRRIEDLLASLPAPLVSAVMSRAATNDDPTSAFVAELRRVAPSSGSVRERLVAHLEPAADSTTIDLTALRERVNAELPAPLRPVAYGVHAELPRTPNGKIDRRAAMHLTVDSSRPADPSSGSNSGAISAQADTLGAVSDIFAATLDSPEIDPDVSFFDLGGHSLLAMELLIQVERRFDVKITVSSLYDHPTPRALAAIIDRLANPIGAIRQNRFLVPIQPLGTKPPIFGIHVLGTNGDYYRPLSEELGLDQPMFGLGQTTLQPDPTAASDVGEIAEQYIDELERCAPTGPVSLAAVSLGAVVAFDMAHRLRARGRDVALLVLFDARGPQAHIHAPAASARLASHARELQRDPRAWVAGRSIRIRGHVRRRTEMTELAMRQQLHVPLSNRLRIREFIEGNYLSQQSYDFERYDGRVQIFRAAHDPYADPDLEFGMGWAAVVPDTLAVTDVEGGHTSMLAAPYVETLAGELSVALDAALDALEHVRVDRETVETSLRVALAEQRLGAELDTWMAQRPSLDDEADELVERSDRSMRALSRRSTEAGREAADALDAAGINTTVGRSPERMSFCAAHLVIEDGSIAAAADVLTQHGYLRHGDSTADACALVRTNDVTTRLSLSSGNSATASAATATASAATGRSISADLGIYLGTPAGLAGEILDLAEVSASDVLVDIGCGDGRILIDAVERFDCTAIGIEIDPALVTLARKRIAAASLSDRIDVIEADAASADLSGASVAFAFLPASAIAELLPSLLDAVGPGGRVIAHEQLATQWPITPTQSTLVVGVEGITVAHLWVAGPARSA